MKYIITLTLALAFSIVLTAQEATEEYVERTNHYIGASGGTTTGAGLSYRYWPGAFGVQLTLLPIITERSVFISFGLTGLKRLKEYERTSLYLFLGNHLLVSPEYDYNYGQTSKTTYNVGFGTGIEIIVLKHISIDLRFGYGVYDIGGKKGLNTNLAGGVGLYYKL